MPIITGRHNRRQIFLDVVLIDLKRNSPDIEGETELSVEMEPVRALVDTGATATSIAPGAAQKLRLRVAGRRQIQTANGPIVAPYYYFKIGFVFPGAIRPVSEPATFYVLPHAVVGSALPFDGSLFDILLGMDVISQGDLAIGRNGEFSFEF